MGTDHAPSRLARRVRRHLFGARLTRAADLTEPAADVPWRRFEVTTNVTLQDQSPDARLWLPLAQTASGYQTVVDARWQGSGRLELARDETYGAPLLRASWGDTAAPRHVEVTQIVATRDRSGLPSVPITRAERTFWTAPTASAPTDGIVRETAERITAGIADPRQRLRAIYDWVVDTTWRDPETPGCGFGDIKSMLETRKFGGKCADINGLMVGLARAAGYPARDVYGIRVGDSRQFPSLGKSGDISKAQHCRAEVFLEDAGWFPVDPADVRKVVLEQKLALNHPDVAALRERLFGGWEMNWIGYNSATDIELPGAGGEKSNFAFLMYPCAITATGQPNALDPTRFRYEIRSRELTA
jgi:transglutaminase-like putative cysteine protease